MAKGARKVRHASCESVYSVEMQADDAGARSMTGWGRGKIAAIGLGVLIAVVFAIVALEALASLCISDNAACSSAPPTVVLLLAPLTVVVGYGLTVWRAQLTPVLLAALCVIPEAVIVGLIWG